MARVWACGTASKPTTPPQTFRVQAFNHPTFEGLATGASTCRIETVEVEVPGAGSP